MAPDRIVADGRQAALLERSSVRMLATRTVVADYPSALLPADLRPRMLRRSGVISPKTKPVDDFFTAISIPANPAALSNCCRSVAGFSPGPRIAS